MGKLAGTRTYLCGPITVDSYKEGNWRDTITPLLEAYGITVINPCRKPTNQGKEDKDRWVATQDAKKRGDFEQVAAGKEVRTIDLRCVDVSDFIIVALDMRQRPFGTIEEMVLANRQKKPVLVVCVEPEGRKSLSDWGFWMLPLEFLFDSFEDLLQYLQKVDSGDKVSSRWVFFNFVSQTPGG